MKIKRIIDKRQIGFILSASILVLLAAQIPSGSPLRRWYRAHKNKPVINKAIEYKEGDVASAVSVGRFVTYYRFRSFGESNPADIDVNAPMIALTFDDGPSPENTERILKVLTENYSHATFFVVGSNAEKYPDTLKAIASAGCEIGNHTYGHANLTKIPWEDAQEQIEKTNRAVNKAIGEDTTVIRPPYGAYDDDLLHALQEPVVLWDLDTEDWDSRDAQKIVDNILTSVQDGDIVLMHDIYDSTADAVEIVVPKLKEQGYQIMSVSEMAAYKGKDLELGKAYGKFQSEE